MTIEANRQAKVLEEFVAAGTHRESLYGIEWGDPDLAPHLRQVRDEWLLPTIGPHATVLEIGSGGGRWSRYFVGRVERAILVDGTPASAAAIRERYHWPAFEYQVSPDGRLPLVGDGEVDYVFSFDTFVHFEAELFNRYIEEIGRVLRPGGLLHLHYARRWPDSAPEAESFRYRSEADVACRLGFAAMSLTERRMEFHGQLGSVLVEARRTKAE
jgi:SAM-dependent methyltransferase